MGDYATLWEHLTEWAGDDPKALAVAETVENLAKAGVAIERIVALGPPEGDMAAKRTEPEEGESAQKELDCLAYRIIADALKASPVAWMGSEADEMAMPVNEGAPLAVNADPLDGSADLDANVTIGTLFSILPSKPVSPLLQPGRNQLAAGYIVYGPRTSMALTLGKGTHKFRLDPRRGEFVLVKANVEVPAATREYAINSSGFRHWDDNIKAYVVDCKLGAEGPRKANFDMRWTGSLVGEAFRILVRGGVYINPADGRKGRTSGRLRLLYEANPIAMIMEQAGGACTTGTQRILDIEPMSLHQRTPLVFGSKTEVEEVAHYYRDIHSLGDHSPLFTKRGLFRSVVG